MFDIGFWELAIIGVVALIVLGPERLPGAARTAGLWVRKARTTLSNVQNEIERELAEQELRKVLDEDTMQSLDEFKDEVKDATKIDELDDLRKETQDEITQTQAAMREVEVKPDATKTNPAELEKPDTHVQRESTTHKNTNQTDPGKSA